MAQTAAAAVADTYFGTTARLEGDLVEAGRLGRVGGELGDAGALSRSATRLDDLAPGSAAARSARASGAADARGGVYLLRNEDGVVMRTGRTNDLTRRELEHARDLPGLSFEPVYRTDVYAEQRGLEELLYRQYPGASLNKIRPINPTNARIDTYMNAAMQFLEGL